MASDEPNPVHVFEKPALYDVTLTVTDTEAGSARSSVQIAADRKGVEPLISLGVSGGERQPLKRHATAR
jgi:PKD repeat protein